MLEIKNLNINFTNLKLSISSLTLEEGKLYSIESDYDSEISQILLLLGGILESSSTDNTKKNGERSFVNREENDSNAKEILKKAILLNGESVYSLEPDVRARKVGFIFENPDWSILAGNVQEDFFYSYAAAGLDFPPLVSLKKYGLYNNRIQKSYTLSGGEKHRLNCACVLEHHRELIICDLSSSNLDLSFREELILWLKQRISEGTIVIFHGLIPNELPPAGKLIYKNGTISFSTEKRSIINEIDTLEGKLIKRNLKESNTLISVENAWGEYSQAGLNFDIKEREIIILKGRNGVGKTTFAKLISERKEASRGKIQYLDKEVLPLMAFQHPEHCFLGTTVMEELPDENLLKMCGINKDEYKTHPRGISRPKQKLLSIAASFYYSKKLSIIDEPTCGLDLKYKILLIELINKFSDLSILIINHDPSLDNYGDQVKYVEI